MTATQLPLSLAQRHNNQQLFSDHYLNVTLPQRPEWKMLAYDAGQALARITPIVRAYVPSDNEAQTEEDLIRPILRALGHTFEVQPALKTPDGTKKPDYGPAIDICTAASLRELATPAIIAVLAPVIIGFGLGPISLGAFLASVIVVGQLMANFLSNSGGAWDNAKKYIEDGAEGGKGSESHKAAVIGDTVGDPFKDTAGPALNPLIKVMNLVSLLILPAIIKLKDDDGPRIAVAVAALVVLIGAELAAALPYLRDGSVRVRRWPGSIFLDVVRMLERLHTAHVAGRPVTAASLRKTLRISFDECELLLERLRVLGWVAPTSKEGWVLARSADSITLAEVYANFVFSVDNDAQSAETDLERRIVSMASQPMRSMDVSLQSLFDLPVASAEAEIDASQTASGSQAVATRA